MKPFLAYFFRNWWGFIFFLYCGISWGQFTIPPKPQNAQAVYDYAQLLKKNEQQLLNSKLIAYADSTSTQIVVATIPSLKGEYEGMLAPEWAHQWGIGQKGKDNGVFILIAQKERKIWISPGYGLEHLLTAGRNGEIIRNFILPEFKKGNYYKGLHLATDKLIELFSGKYKADTLEKKSHFFEVFVFFLLIALPFLWIFFSRRNQKKHYKNTDAELLMDIFFTILSSKGSQNISGKSFGNGSNFGGGFSGGFGGGGFSGGGAGGSW